MIIKQYTDYNDIGDVSFTRIELMQHDTEKIIISIDTYFLKGLQENKLYFVDFDLINFKRYRDYIHKLQDIKKLGCLDHFKYYYLYLKNVINNNKVVCYE